MKPARKKSNSNLGGSRRFIASLCFISLGGYFGCMLGGCSAVLGGCRQSSEIKGVSKTSMVARWLLGGWFYYYVDRGVGVGEGRRKRADFAPPAARLVGSLGDQTLASLIRRVKALTAFFAADFFCGRLTRPRQAAGPAMRALAIAQACVLLSLLVGTAQAQDMDHTARDHWYESDCCSAKDCRPANEGEVEYLPHHPTGPAWFVRTTNEIFSNINCFSTADPCVRPSQDNRLHVCIVRATGEYGPVDRVRCIYIPPIM